MADGGARKPSETEYHGHEVNAVIRLRIWVGNSQGEPRNWAPIRISTTTAEEALGRSLHRLPALTVSATCFEYPLRWLTTASIFWDCGGFGANHQARKHRWRGICIGSWEGLGAAESTRNCRVLRGQPGGDQKRGSDSQIAAKTWSCPSIDGSVRLRPKFSDLCFTNIPTAPSVLPKTKLPSRCSRCRQASCWQEQKIGVVLAKLLPSQSPAPRFGSTPPSDPPIPRPPDRRTHRRASDPGVL